MLNKDYAPVLIPTLNRFEHLKQLIDSLLQCEEAKYTELVIGLDYPPSEKYWEGYQKVKAYLPTITGFGKVTILDTNDNLGAVENSNRLKDYAESQKYDSFIISEDDNVFAPAFLSYMNWGLRSFKDDESILAICSYREKDEPIPNYPNNFYKANGIRPYGYGMWYDRYHRYKKRIEFSYMKSLVDRMPLCSVFSFKKVRIASLYLYFVKKKTTYGDFCMGQMCIDDNMFCITPIKTLSKNVGSDGSGLHGIDFKRQERELARHFDTTKFFLPIWEEQSLYTQDVMFAEKQIAREQSHIDLKQILRCCFWMFKFMVYKATGTIISYKQN